MVSFVQKVTPESVKGMDLGGDLLFVINRPAFVGPLKDRASQVIDILKTSLSHTLYHERGAIANGAIHNKKIVGFVMGLERLGRRMRRSELGVAEVAHMVFRGLSCVEKDGLFCFRPLEPRGELLGCDVWRL